MFHKESNRRTFLRFATGSAALAIMYPTTTLASTATNTKNSGIMTFNNLHTGEKLTTALFSNGQIVLSELDKINHICRDFRRNEVHQIDDQLLTQLNLIQATLKTDADIQIISGYRSPATNEKLRSGSSGVAKKSFHMLGKALDFRLEGVPLDEVRDAAVALRVGGVGYYPNSNFVHIDTGTVRTW